MEGVTIIQTKELEGIRDNISTLTNLVIKLAKEVKLKDPLLTALEVQEYLKKGSTWLDANKHKIGCSRVGGEWRFRKSSVDEYLELNYYKEN